MCKVDKLRNILEKGGHWLTHSSHSRRLMPLILKQGIERLKGEIAFCSSDGVQFTRDLSVIFDGSTRLDEAILIIVRFIEGNCIKNDIF